MRKLLLAASVLGTIFAAATGQLASTVQPDVPVQTDTLIHLVDQAPVQITRVASGTYLVDFGRVAFGNLSLSPPVGLPVPGGALTVRFGEALKDGRVDTQPPGSVRFAQVRVVPDGEPSMIVAPPADARNTRGHAVLTPPSWGVLTPFRWVEIDGWPAELQPGQIHRRASFDRTWIDDAGSFQFSDPMLDRIWDLCHYTIKAATFAGIFVDGDRERLAYEADAYLTQLGYYDGDADPRIPRVTFDRLMRYPTWPSEWAPHMVFMAYADWRETGDLAWLAARYEFLKTKLLSERLGPDGMVTSSPELIRKGDIVDWPADERDGYVFTGENTVVNAFRLRALDQMAALAQALGRQAEANGFQKQAATGRAVFLNTFFDAKSGLFRDGAGTDHMSLHANLFPLAFDLVPRDRSPHVAQWLATRGMAASVYGAQYLLEALFENGEDAAALHLMTAPGDRSWRHMVDSGATMTWEAWDQHYKPNQDWNHAWGAAPANLLPRFVLGAQPLMPGWRRALIRPHPGDLRTARGRIPTPRGELVVSWTHGQSFLLDVQLPPGMTARVELPALIGSGHITVSGVLTKAHREGAYWTLDHDVSGTVTIAESPTGLRP